MQAKSTFAIRGKAQFRLTVVIQRNGAKDRKILYLQHRRIRMEQRCCSQGSLCHCCGWKYCLTE